MKDFEILLILPIIFCVFYAVFINEYSNYNFNSNFHPFDVSRKIRISCQDPEEELKVKTPIEAEIHCASGITFSGGGSGVSVVSESLVAKGKEIRALKVTLEVIDPATGAVLDTETVTRLQ